MLLEALGKIDALAEHLQLKLQEMPCKNSVCRDGRWPDGGFCTTCGGSGRVYAVHTPQEPTGDPERLETYEEDDDD